MARLLRWLAFYAAVAFGALLLFSAHDHSAFAQPKASEIDKARELMEEGQALFKEGRYKDAMLKFEQAYETHAFSAFRYNAALAAEKSGDLQRAIARYNEYLASDPESPYAEQVKAKIKELEETLSKPAVEPPATGRGGAGGDGGGGDGGAAPPPPEAAPVPADAASIAEIRSLVFIESDPAGAPVSIHERVVPTAAPFNANAPENPGWREIVKDVKTPADLTLKVGHYHIVIDKFQDFNKSDTELNLKPGEVYKFKANLSQGAFLGALLLKTNVEHAKVFVDDAPPHKSAPLFRGTDTRDLNKGDHQLWVEAPGYQAEHRTFAIQQGETTEIDVQLTRVDYGYLVIDGNVESMEIEIDQKPFQAYAASGEPLKIKLSSGKHTVAFDADGRKEFVGEVDVPKGQELPVHANLTDSYPRGKAIALGILAVGAGVGGIFLHLEAEKPIGDPHNEDVHQVFNVTRFVAWGASGLFAGLAIFYAVYDPNPDSLVKYDDLREFPEGGQKKKPTTQKSTWLIPFLGPDGGGLGVVGSF